ncbi:ATP-binding cassette domain-containing protein [Bailinhaonella thermotolerans]|uniref:ATP-binding cassette domain-containing protein n=1 Tax=Bailinhaonella thermotolerans TaxID=1070861 RepID=A0A3A4A1R3_9ACTN|nr:ATP-binding cassette domain-containing protein [Bailinhaonella thermotolerans]RJL20386.1 ATP-binding cassette domain-containing protein [Bailinhaonella thermotolerans]
MSVLSTQAIVVERLARHFRSRRDEVTALDGVDFAVARGTVCGLLGPNGAGKTTAVRVLATLLRPDAGRALVAGYDVVRDPAKVRRRIGLAGQHAAVDELLGGRANLEMIARLYGMPARAARRRADELLERFELTEAAGRLARTYSGGMRRRLDLAASLLVAPEVLFLDEPTTGLDPRSRTGIWDTIAELRRSGTTVLLTTQYLEEADRLAGQIVVIDRGRVIADGTPDGLKGRREHVDVVVADEADVPVVRAAVAGALGRDDLLVDATTISAAVDDGPAALTAVLGALAATGAAVTDVARRRPTLDDVFLDLTGRAAHDPEEPGAAAPAERERTGRAA